MNEQHQSHEVIRDEAYYVDVANKLELLNDASNSGRGYGHIRDTIPYIRRGSLDAARQIITSDFDKWPREGMEQAQALIEDALFFDEDHESPWEQRARLRRELLSEQDEL